MSIFVYDYDYNAPSIEHLKDTHKRMFQAIRTTNPNIPIIMMSCPKYCITREETERLHVIKTTYETALFAGDKNVYFIDGLNFQVGPNQYEMSVDGIHPNDAGFIRMANCIGTFIRHILERR